MGLEENPAIFRKMVIRVSTFSICVPHSAAVHQPNLHHECPDLSPSASSDLTSEGDLISKQTRLITHANGRSTFGIGSMVPMKQMAA